MVPDGKYVPWHVCGSQRKTFGTWLSPPFVGSNTKFRLSGLYRRHLGLLSIFTPLCSPSNFLDMRWVALLWHIFQPQCAALDWRQWCWWTNLWIDYLRKHWSGEKWANTVFNMKTIILRMVFIKEGWLY